MHKPAQRGHRSLTMIQRKLGWARATCDVCTIKSNANQLRQVCRRQHPDRWGYHRTRLRNWGTPASRLGDMPQLLLESSRIHRPSFYPDAKPGSIKTTQGHMARFGADGLCQDRGSNGVWIAGRLHNAPTSCSACPRPAPVSTSNSVDALHMQLRAVHTFKIARRAPKNFSPLRSRMRSGLDTHRLQLFALRVCFDVALRRAKHVPNNWVIVLI